MNLSTLINKSTQPQQSKSTPLSPVAKALVEGFEKLYPSMPAMIRGMLAQALVKSSSDESDIVIKLKEIQKVLAYAIAQESRTPTQVPSSSDRGDGSGEIDPSQISDDDVAGEAQSSASDI